MWKFASWTLSCNSTSGKQSQAYHFQRHMGTLGHCLSYSIYFCTWENMKTPSIKIQCNTQKLIFYLFFYFNGLIYRDIKEEIIL